MWEIWAKIIVAEGFKKWPKVQKIAQSGHTVLHRHTIELENHMEEGYRLCHSTVRR